MEKVIKKVKWGGFSAEDYPNASIAQTRIESELDVLPTCLDYSLFLQIVIAKEKISIDDFSCS